MAALVGFQAFRLPLEILLHRFHAEGAVPVQMTWSGQNLDVFAGIAALVTGLLAARRELPAAAIWGFQLLATGLLLNVARVAMRSTPGPFFAFPDEPPLLLALHLPYAWIVPICVSGALAGHLILLRRQLGR